MTTKSIFAVALSIAAFASAAPAMAQDVPPTRVVAVADLDLTTTAGLTEMDRRLDVAVTAVCGRNSPLDLSGNLLRAQCRKNARAPIDQQRTVAIAMQQSRKTQMASVR